MPLRPCSAHCESDSYVGRICTFSLIFISTELSKIHPSYEFAGLLCAPFCLCFKANNQDHYSTSTSKSIQTKWLIHVGLKPHAERPTTELHFTCAYRNVGRLLMLQRHVSRCKRKRERDIFLGYVTDSLCT